VSDEQDALRAIYESDPSLLRPDTPDMARLLDVVVQMEALRASGMSAEQAYEDIVDVMSVAYLAAQRTGMNLDEVTAALKALNTLMEMQAALGKPLTELPTSVGNRILKSVRELTSNSWAEGFAYGVTFQREGGHRPNST
jgi:hypothetical protein